MENIVKESAKDIDLAAIKLGIRAKRVGGVHYIHCDTLRPFRRNPRTEYKGLEPLKAAMSEDGFDSAHPLIVNRNTGEVLSGNTRLLSAQAMSEEWKAANLIPVVYYEGLTHTQEDLLAFEGNELRFPLLFSEECLLYKTLIDNEDGWTVRAIEKLKRLENVRGRGKSTVDNYYRCGRNLAPEVLKAVDDKFIRIKMAEALSREGADGKLVFSHENQRGIVQDPQLQGANMRQFADYLRLYLDRRDALRADKNQLDLVGFDGMDFRSDDSCTVESPETERRRLNVVKKLLNHLVRKGMVGLPMNKRPAFMKKAVGSAIGKETPTDYLRERLGAARLMLDDALLFLDSMDSPAADAGSTVANIYSPASEGRVPEAFEELTSEDDVDNTEPPKLLPARRVRSTVEREHLTEEKVAAC